MVIASKQKERSCFPTDYWLLATDYLQVRHFAHGFDDALHVWEREPLKVLGVGHGRVRAGDTTDGGVQVVEGALHDLRADLGGHAAEGVRLLRDDDAVRLLHRTDDRLDVERADGAWVNDLDRDRSEEHTSELQSRQYLVCRLLLEK